MKRACASCVVGVSALALFAIACTETHPTSTLPNQSHAESSFVPPTATNDADGYDAMHPQLAPADANFRDDRRGWGWSDRCWNELGQGQLGYARAACDRGLAIPDLAEAARAALLYNEGLIAKDSGDLALARVYLEKSLAIRPATDPQLATVEGALLAAGGRLPPKTFACGGARCSTDQTCCDDGAHAPLCTDDEHAPDWCWPMINRRACDPKTYEPCGRRERCCAVKLGGPLTITFMCAAPSMCLY